MKPAETKDLHSLHLKIDPELHRRLRVMAADRDRTVSAETRRAIEDRLAEYEQGADTGAAA